MRLVKSYIIKHTKNTGIFFNGKNALVIQNNISEDCNLISRLFDYNDLFINILEPGKPETMLFRTAKRLGMLENHDFKVKINERIINNTLFITTS